MSCESNCSKEILERADKVRAQWAANDAVRDKDLKEPEGVVSYCDLVYSTYAPYNRLNLYMPPKDMNLSATAKDEKQAHKLPVVVAIHGGGYFYGDKELYRFYCMDLAMRGFAVVDFDYRLAPQYLFPAPIEDTVSVLEWVVREQVHYGLDVENVFFIGDSAGSQLASQMAVLWANPDYAKTFGLRLPDIQVRAVGLACGVYDLHTWVNAKEQRELVDQYIGPDYDPEDPRFQVLEAVNENYPPTFIFSAYNDFLLQFCEPMAELIASHGVEVVSKIYGTPEDKHIAHVFHVDFRYPEGEACRAEQAEFFRKHVVSGK